MLNTYNKKEMCPNCLSIMIPDIEVKKIIFEINKDNIEVEAERAVCTNCKEEFLVKGIDDGYALAYQKYKIKNNYLLPEQIKGIREKYGMTQKQYSLLLGFGEITIHRYENGSLQDKSHDVIMKLSKIPDNMMKMFVENKSRISTDEQTVIEKCIKQNIEDYSKAMKEIKEYFNYEPNEFNGYKKFDIDRTINTILLILENTMDAWTTQIVKYLFYLDFITYKKLKKPFIGLEYIRDKHGPLVNNYEKILNYMVQEVYLKQQHVNTKNHTGRKYTLISHPVHNFFSEEEIKFIDAIINKLKDKTPTELSEKTHNEFDGWILTPQGEKISYDKYADRVNI
jgi:putative zinc finger/helix-turn-helix YgiT family protein